MSPLSILFGKRPSYDHLKVFSSFCYASTLKSGVDKFQAGAAACVFLGYRFGQKAYKLLNLETHQVFTSRDVAFHEIIFPYQHILHTTGSLIFPPNDSYNFYDPEQTSPSPLSSSRVESSSGSSLLPSWRSNRLHKTPYLVEYICGNVFT